MTISRSFQLRPVYIVLLCFAVAAVGHAQSLAPSSLSGQEIILTETTGSAPLVWASPTSIAFTASGFSTLDLSGTTTIADQANGSGGGFGTYAYTATSGTVGQVVCQYQNSGNAGNETVTLTFTTAVGGTFKATQGSGTATGTFSLTPNTSGLVNLSNLVQLAAGGTATMGFVVGGTVPRKVIIRAIGPTLATFGVSNPVSNATLSLYQGSAPIAINGGWGGSSVAAAALVAAFAQTGAFSLPANSGDSAILATLQPGAYTTSAAAGNTDDAGTILVEVYFVQ